MKKPLYLISLVLLTGCYSKSLAQANWYTSEVRKELGQKVVPGTPAEAPPFRTEEYKLKNCRIVSGAVAIFDTVATYAQGRVVDAISHKPVKGALIQVSYSCFGSEILCNLRTASTNSAGFFRLGWVGCGGPHGGRSNRPLQIKAVGYPLVSTQQVSFGGAAYLHIELAPSK
ncbi:hypothetical protein [Hymenobacter bucti]|uniref:Lipoprotein n=1 Tax=Hymenobacter bucti TaxID=1844114 RepID=A0ABW4QXP2_9BACT